MLTKSEVRSRSARFLAGVALAILLFATFPAACRRQSSVFVIALSDNLKTIDPIGSPSVDAASERVRALMFNSLVKKDEKFDYVPELASKIDRSEDGLTFTFTLHDGVTFHDGRPFTSADAKYTLDTLQAELQSGRVDIAPLPTSLSPDSIKGLSSNPNLNVHQFDGSNLNLLTFNTTEPPLDNVKVRQAIAYAINRESMIRDLALGQGKIAHSILPEESWAYTPGQTYHYDPAMAKKLLDEAGFRDPDGDGPQMRFAKPITFRISGSSASARQYAGVIQNSLKDVGIPVTIETMEINTLLESLRRGQFQMYYLHWVGGNQDPIFYKDLFASSEIP